MRAVRQSVVGAVGADRDAEMPALAEVRCADRAGARADRTVGQGAERVLFVRVFVVVIMVVIVVFGHLGEARDVEVAGVADQAVDMQHEVVAADAVEAEHAAALVVAAGGAQFGAAADRTVRHFACDAAVDHVDRAADRAAAVQQVGRALEHLDLVGEEGLDADRVVGADRRRIHAADAAREHLHARAFLSADDRPADAGTERAALHAGQRRHGVTEVAGLAIFQRVAIQHLHRVREILGVAAERRGGDLHAVERGRMRMGLAGGLGERGGRQQQGHGDGETGRDGGGTAASGHCGCSTLVGEEGML